MRVKNPDHLYNILLSLSKKKAFPRKWLAKHSPADEDRIKVVMWKKEDLQQLIWRKIWFWF